MPPLVLVLDEARVRPAYDDRDELVAAAAADEVGDVELGGRARVLGDAYRLSVQQDVQHALDAAEAEHDASPGPGARDREEAPVDARRVLLRDVRRPLRERHRDVRVLRYVVAEHRPEARDPHRVPTTCQAECPRRVVGSVDEPEIPVAVERALETGGSL